MHEKKNVILAVNNEPQLLKILSALPGADNYKCISALNGGQAVRMCDSVKPDLVLLSLSLPDTDGCNVITAIRASSQVPIIVLSECLSDTAVVAALNAGANDYITKPFNPAVLAARINACLRSGVIRELGEAELCNGAVRIDPVRHEVFVNGGLMPFTPKEYDLLRCFMINCGKMLTHRKILQTVWGSAHDGDIAYLRVYIGQIRKKIAGVAAGSPLIATEPGVGYRMERCPPPLVF